MIADIYCCPAIVIEPLKIKRERHDLESEAMDACEYMWPSVGCDRRGPSQDLDEDAAAQALRQKPS